MELISGWLSCDEILEELDSFVQLLRDAEIATVYVTFGFGCSVESLVQIEDVPVATDELVGFIEDSESRGVYTLGEDDLSIRSGVRGLYFLLCHEHDVHFTSKDDHFLRCVRNRWASLYRDSHAFHGEGRHIRLYGQVKRGQRG